MPAADSPSPCVVSGPHDHHSQRQLHHRRRPRGAPARLRRHAHHGRRHLGRRRRTREARRVLRRAVELGVNLIDTADSYGPDVSEELIAEALAPVPGRSRDRHQGRPARAPARASGRATAVPSTSRRLRGQPAPAAARPRSTSTSCTRPTRRCRYEELGGRPRGAAGGGQDPPHRDLERLRRAARAGPCARRGRRPCRTATTSADRDSEDVLEACERDGIGFIPWFPLATGELATPGGPLDEIAGSARRHRRPRSRWPGCCRARR